MKKGFQLTLLLMQLSTIFVVAWLLIQKPGPMITTYLEWHIRDPLVNMAYRLILGERRVDCGAL